MQNHLQERLEDNVYGAVIMVAILAVWHFGLVVKHCSGQRRYSAPGPVSAGMGNRLQASKPSK